MKVKLALQIGVQKDIPLPTSTQHMIFFNFANVADEDIQQAKEVIKKRCDQAAFEQYLKNWELYQKFQRSQEVLAFDQLNEKHVESIEKCPISGGFETQILLIQNKQQISYEDLKKWYIKNRTEPFY